MSELKIVPFLPEAKPNDWDSVAREVDAFIRQHAKKGWRFLRFEHVLVNEKTNPGCLASVFGDSGVNRFATYQMAIFEIPEI